MWSFILASQFFFEFTTPSKVIMLILAANAAVGVITETNAEKALEELRAYQANIATVLRNGCFSILPANLVKTAQKSKTLLTDIERWQKGVASSDGKIIAGF